MNLEIYNKLVRNKTAEIVELQGNLAKVKKLQPEEVYDHLKLKLAEETQEFLLDENLEELADIIEVVNQLACQLGYTEEELYNAVKEKREIRGSFSEGVFLETVFRMKARQKETSA